MATSNFYNENASRIFAAELEEEFDYDDLISNLEYAIRDNSNSFSSGRSGEYLNNNSKILDFSLSNDFNYVDNISVEVVVHPVIRSGYYSGANLDWVFDFFIDGCDIEDETDIANYLMKYEDYSESKATALGESRFKRLEILKNSLTNQLEKIYADYTTPLVVTARFSNGETLYEKA
jgi:hypothetical protein